MAEHFMLPASNKSPVINWKERCSDLLENILIENKLSDCKETSSSLLKKKESIEKKSSSQLDEIKRIQRELNEMEPESQKDPNKYRMKLYQLITNITWDLDSLPNEVRGYVSKPFDVFNLNTETHSTYFITNYLWKLIDKEKASTNVNDIWICFCSAQKLKLMLENKDNMEDAPMNTRDTVWPRRNYVIVHQEKIPLKDEESLSVAVDAHF